MRTGSEISDHGGYMNNWTHANENVMAYLERFQLFITANAIKAAPTLLTVVGVNHFSLLHGMVSPELPKDKTFYEQVEIQHYDPEHHY